MDDKTAAVFTVQLLALAGIVGSLLLYLLCKIRRRRSSLYDSELDVGTGRSILVTSCDALLGLQLALHFSGLGFRVFAGFNGDPDGLSTAARVLRAKLKAREGSGAEVEDGRVGTGSTVILPLDVTREDSLHEAVNVVRRHLPAGEDGLWAVINTAGVCLKGRLEQQDSSQWDAMFKVNVIGTLRTARAFLPLLKNKRGRLLNIGVCEGSTPGMVAYTAARHGVAGACVGLRQEFSPLGVHVVTIQPDTTYIASIFAKPRISGSESPDKDEVSPERYTHVNISAVPCYALGCIEEAVLTEAPRPVYTLKSPGGFSNYVAAITDRFTFSSKISET